MKIMKQKSIKYCLFYSLTNCSILHGHVCVMAHELILCRELTGMASSKSLSPLRAALKVRKIHTKLLVLRVLRVLRVGFGL